MRLFDCHLRLVIISVGFLRDGDELAVPGPKHPSETEGEEVRDFDMNICFGCGR